MIVEPDKAATELLLANGIEGTRDGLAPRGAPVMARPFQGAKAAIVDGVAVCPVVQILITSEHAILAVHNARHQVAVTVGISHALSVDHALGRSRKLGPNLVETGLNAPYLVERYRCAGIALDTAPPLAGIEITAEFFGENIGGNQYVPYLKNVKFHKTLFQTPASCGSYHSISAAPCARR